ncbi:hypothetical protein DZA55_12135 [Xanthomonas oryzae pv. oryzae]|nr:hypothetical protein BRN51_14095 [Xanthomonas oryzae pv. oryzae]QBA11064.1 hypothetical protein DZA53_11580 [Xanthomonas oryzae pv. oryzae]QBA14912.1 hypothetical protein DZA55_12135 [Xanthomonas oryzae pv. oryzae]QBN91264.1 hypothetical protein EBA18_15180 [Xanthomonas oryzae pv. oryzae]QBN94518.1 hypothetical protein EBA19_10405 [Xanthomonas oryzae pv. oryzae]
MASLPTIGAKNPSGPSAPWPAATSGCCTPPCAAPPGQHRQRVAWIDHLGQWLAEEVRVPGGASAKLPGIRC